MIRRYGEQVRHSESYTFRPGAYAVLPYKTKILLTHQAEPQPEFQLPGGGIDPGEGPLQALHREVFEETGWKIGYARKLGAFRRFTYMPEYDLWAEKLCHIYLAQPVRRFGPPLETAHTATFVDPELAPELVANDGDRAFLLSFLRS